MLISREKIKKEFERLPLGEHFCCIYKNKEEQLEVVIPYIVIGLESNEKCIYIVDENTKEEISAAFAKLGIDIAKYIRSGQFEFFTKEDAYLKEGYFDPDKMIQLLKEAEKKAIGAGYSGLRVTGEMTWVFTKLPGVDRLMEYEAKLNYFFPESRSTAICQYNETKFKPEVLLDVIYAHPKVIIYGLICDNHHYVPPGEFLARMKDGVSAAVYERVKGGIIKRAEIESELNRVTEELKEKDRRLRAVFDQTFEFIGLMRTDGVLIEANRAALEFSGIKEPDVIGRPFWETPWWTHSVQLQEKLREAVGQAAAGKFVRFEATHLSKDKTLHYIDFSLKPVKDESGKVTFLIPEGRDITQMKIAQESLERSAAEWDRTFNSISDFIFIQDINHTIVRANAAFFKALGAEPKDILGKKCYQILHKTDFPWPDCPLEQTKIDLKSHTQEVDDPKIGVILLVSTSPVLNEEGELAGIVHIAKDISAQKKIEIELKKRVTDLERFQKVTVDRELRMKELKAKIAELEKRLAEL